MAAQPEQHQTRHFRVSLIELGQCLPPELPPRDPAIAVLDFCAQPWSLLVLDFGFQHTRFAVLNSSEYQTHVVPVVEEHTQTLVSTDSHTYILERTLLQLEMRGRILGVAAWAEIVVGCSRRSSLNGVAEEPREGCTNRCSERRKRKEKLGGVAALLDDMERRRWRWRWCAALRGTFTVFRSAFLGASADVVYC
ncbi:hypothetical protein FA15DRAFT_309429 [Coprinopsis marcescibilis]|uniref:Uncharacterized protein n=1 Tax=Coprinopsis marcescibilis TaxID=230819 RepID=A0A5C3KDI3_COPMA|nr:hypothetical protein FA15DRAFT_309429 [Coprinopsis marcescibilis]